ncbi:unnamed protein product [Ilex paraguariensis]|uniref:Uncharacterized protein n=1 Tax=Ilex paraguariensis TaxID=185542 RepID=A0ABC8SAU0_9AQUA
MAVRIVTFLSVFLILLIYSSAGTVKGFDDGVNTISSIHKGGVRLNSRKLLVHESVLDYDDAGANTKHDPRKGKPGGGGGKNH